MKKSLPGHTELIDTLWNVNSLISDISHLSDIELIDTLWNVNCTLQSKRLFVVWN